VAKDDPAERRDRYQRAGAAAGGALTGAVIAGPAGLIAGAFRPTGVPRVRRAGDSVPEPTWSPTELGEQVFLRFRGAGTNLPDAWTSSNAGHGESDGPAAATTGEQEPER
jgi:hypothetical protein